MPADMQALITRSLLDTLGALSSDGIFAKDTGGRFVFVNSTACQMTGADSPADMVGKTDFDFTSADLARGFFDDDQTVIRSGQPLVGVEELVVNGKTGEQRWHRTTKAPWHDQNGQILGVISIARDITTLKAAESEVYRLNTELEQRVRDRTAELQAITETLEWERNLMRTLVDALPDLIYAKDIQGRFLLANRSVAHRMGTEPQELLGKTDFDYFPKDIAQHYHNDEQQIVTSGQPLFDREEPHIDATTGRTRWLLTSKIPVRGDQAGTVIALVGIGRDISKRREVELALERSEERFRSLTELSSDWYWEQDEHLRFIALTDHNAKSSYLESQVIGKTLQELTDTASLSGSWQEYNALFAAHQPFRDIELRHVMADGQVRHISLSGLPILSDAGEFRGYRGIGCDITERKTSEEQVQYLASHDSLTALPNRMMFSKILNLAIESARRYQRKLAVLFIDLDRFKNINDTLGHYAGDLMLQETALRLKQSLRASDVVGRLGGDEFAILLQEVDEPEEIPKVAQKVLSACIEPMIILGQECRVTASIGIAIYPTDSQKEQTLMRYADIAMYRAKEEGKNNYQFYSPGIKARSLERLKLENNLRRALERNEFFLHYQAKRSLTTGSVSGIEALLRWQHPELGIVSPAQFIPLAEETGLIVPIGAWVLNTACQQNMRWQKQGFAPLCMAVNLSARQFFDDRLVQDVADALKNSGMDPQWLEMEITEGMVMQDAERATRILTAIKSLGIRLAIDDFGVGYSSLAQIKRFPIDTLKVDSSFIRDLPQNAEDRAITEAIIAMGKTLSLSVIAEGVETKEQETFLRAHACDESQGFYFSRPMTPEQFTDLLRHPPEIFDSQPPPGSKKK